MNRKLKVVRFVVWFVLVGLLLIPLGTLSLGSGEPVTSSEDQQNEKSGSERTALSSALLALAAALAVGLCAVGTGIAQSRIGAAGCGTLAERPESATTVILLVAIPETMVILGFVVAVVILFVA